MNPTQPFPTPDGTDPAVYAALRRKFPANLLRRSDAARLLKAAGFGRSTLENWCQHPPGEKPVRLRVPGMKEYRYNRDNLLHYVLGGQ